MGKSLIITEKPSVAQEFAKVLQVSGRRDGYIENQNARYVMNRHPERQRYIEDLYKNDKTCPEESIYQIGNIDESISAETLRMIVETFFEEWQERFGTHIKMLDWSLHCDEATPQESK